MRSRKSALGLLIGAGAVVACAGTLSWGQNRSNPGPQDAEIKFKVPAEPAYSPQEALAKFELDERFEIQLVASEPMVEEPVALAFAETGKLFVVEMRGYMHDVTRKGEDQPIGRVKLLEDVDGDGRMDKATVFVDGLVMPRAVMPLAGGVLIAEPPNLTHYRDTDGDGVADAKTVVFDDSARKGGPPEHMANEPTWAMDNWIYSAKWTKRYRYNGGKWISETTPLRGQWGIAQDDFGRLYYNYNPELLRADLVPAHYLSRNPNFTGGTGFNFQVCTDQTVWPIRQTPGVNRGYQAGVLRDDGTLRTATAACAPIIYRAELFPDEFRGNAFAAEPAGNLIKRLLLSEQDGVVRARPADAKQDFLASTDERFRPVDIAVGPDGAMYVADLYRGVLQHGIYLTHYLIRNIKERELESPLHLGRIWRIVPKGSNPRPVKMPAENVALVEMLTNGNGWVRDTAQRLLVERKDPKTVVALRRLLRTCPNAITRLHCLWTLEGMGSLERDTVLEALNDPDAKVRAAAVRLCEPHLVPATLPEVMPALAALAAKETAYDVKLQLALSLGPVQSPEAERVVHRVLSDRPDDALLRSSVMSGLRGRELETIERWAGTENAEAASASVLRDLATAVMNERRASRVTRLFDLAGKQKDATLLAFLEGMAGGPPGGGRRGGAAAAPPNLLGDAAEDGAGARGAGAPAGTAPAGTTPAGTTPAGTTPPTGAAAPGAGRANRFGARPVRLIYLDKEPAPLAAWLADTKTKSLAERVNARVAWPGKPGVAPPPVVRALTEPESALFEKGKAVYANTCVACHLPNGVGQDGLAPPLVDSEWVLGSPERVARIVMHGVAGPIRVNGVDFNMEMPGLATLTDEEIAAVVTYVRREWEHGADPVTVETVKRIRDAEGERGMWSAEELGKTR